MAKQVSVRMDDKGRLTLPRSIREAMHAEPGDVFYLQSDGGSIRIVKSENPFDALAQHALNEYEAGRTRDIREIAADLDIDLNAEEPNE